MNNYSEQLSNTTLGKEAIPIIKQMEVEQDHFGLLKALSHPNLDVKLMAIKSLGNFSDNKIMPQLIDELEKQKYPMEGSETATLHQTYKKKLIEVIEKLSENKVEVNNINNAKEIENAVTHFKSWAQKNIKNKDV
jgi:hypothetical protein